MQGSEVLEALKQGKKVRKVCWAEENFIYMVGGQIRNKDRQPSSWYIEDLFNSDWEIYKEEITFNDVPMGVGFKVVKDKNSMYSPPTYIKIPELFDKKNCFKEGRVNCILIDYPNRGQNLFGFLEKTEKVVLV